MFAHIDRIFPKINPKSTICGFFAVKNAFLYKEENGVKSPEWAVLRSAMLNLRCSNRLKKIFSKNFKTLPHLKKAGNINIRNLNFLRNNTVVSGNAGFFLCIVNERKQRTILTKSPKTKIYDSKKTTSTKNQQWLSPLL
jgi:hypothetical protein